MRSGSLVSAAAAACQLLGYSDDSTSPPIVGQVVVSPNAIALAEFELGRRSAGVFARNGAPITGIRIVSNTLLTAIVAPALIYTSEKPTAYTSGVLQNQMHWF